MRLLFDQNLSFRLVGILGDVYQGSTHVRNLNMSQSTDAQIWNYAADHGFTIVSKDTDFHSMSLLYGHPPKVIWLRIGNHSTKAAADLLREHHETVKQFHVNSETAFLTLG